MIRRIINIFRWALFGKIDKRARFNLLTFQNIYQYIRNKNNMEIEELFR